MSDWLYSCSDREQLLRRFGEANPEEGTTIVEVGVYEGDFSAQILEFCPASRLCAVDPWAHQSAGYNDPCNLEQEAFDELYVKCRNRLLGSQRVMEDGRPRVNLVRLPSAEAAQLLVGPYDLIYLDGNHSFAGIREDIELWYPKVKPGGILAGHDYTHNPDPDVCGVIPAVQRFVKQHGLQLQLMLSTGDCSWAVRKPS